MDPFTSTFRFRVALLHLYRAFHYHIEPFTPWASPGREFGVICTGSVFSLQQNEALNITL